MFPKFRIKNSAKFHIKKVDLSDSLMDESDFEVTAIQSRQ